MPAHPPVAPKKERVGLVETMSIVGNFDLLLLISMMDFASLKKQMPSLEISGIELES